MTTRNDFIARDSLQPDEQERWSQFAISGEFSGGSMSGGNA
jgi:hypothetical protein